MRVGLASLVLVAVLVGGAPAHAGWRHDRCRYQSVEVGKWTPDEVRWTIRCAADHFGVSADTALYVAQRESNLEWWATNRYSGACGIYQHLPRYWPSRYESFLARRPGLAPVRPSCYNARSNVLVALNMAASSWGPWS